MERIEMQIGGLYYIWRIGQDGKPIYVGLYYYVGCGKFSDEISPLFYRYPISADIAIPIDNDGKIESSLFSKEIKIDSRVCLFDYRINNKEIIDIESKNLNEFEWWHEFVEKYNLKK